MADNSPGAAPTSKRTKLSFKPTGNIETIEGVPCRRWDGTDEHGTWVHVWVRMFDSADEAEKFRDSTLLTRSPQTVGGG
jgi:hypothetical protein